jgi:superfamily II DNA/RNA helicase
MDSDSAGRFKDFTMYLMSGGLDPVKKETQMLTPGLDILITTPDRLVGSFFLPAIEAHIATL